MHKFRSQLEADVKALGLKGRFRAYSFRRGGATHMWIHTSNLGAITTRGRWSATKTARIYIDEAVAEVSKIHRSAAANKAIASHIAYLHKNH